MDINWTYWRSFLAVLETGSLSGAARRLSMTQPTVGRHIESLEQALEVSLFTRSQDGLSPTNTALVLKAHAETMAASASALTRLAAGSDTIQGTVRLTASEIVGVEVLPPVLAAMKRAHNGLSVELALSNAQHDLLRRDADIAVRMVRPTQKRLVAKKIGGVSIGLFAHADYLREKSLPQTPEALFEHDLIGLDRDSDRWAGFAFAKRNIKPDDLAFRSDSDLAQLSMLRAGGGIGICQEHIAACDDDLVRVLVDSVSFELEMWLVMHEDMKAHRAIRAAFDFLGLALREAIKP